MKRVGRDASLHEKTVQAAVDNPWLTRRRPTPRKPPEVTVLQVHPGIWATALELAGGDARRITVLSPTKVEVYQTVRPDR